MMIKKFNQFNTSEWVGPLKVLDIKENTVYTNFGNFSNKSENKLTVGYSYILRVIDNEIVDTGMSCVDLIVLVDTGTNYKVLQLKEVDHHLLVCGLIQVVTSMKENIQ